MARRRFFVPEIRGGEAQLEGDEARHLTRVLRVEVEQKYEISDGSAVWLAEVTAARKDRVEFRVIDRLELAPPGVVVTLYASLIKFDHFELLIEKATELGVDSIVPVIASRSEAGLEKAVERRIDRWDRIALEASQQSRRDRPPELRPIVSFDEALAAEGDYRFWLDEIAGGVPLLNAVPAERKPDDLVALLIGPEGGWTDAERAKVSAEQAWRRVWLGPQILRAETAAIAALAVIMAAWRKA